MKSILFALSLVAGQVSAGLLGGITPANIHGEGPTERAVKRVADSLIDEMNLGRRQETAVAATSNETAWDAQAAAACQKALAGTTPTNPTGLAGCYNLPTLDQQTGVFQADLRLYKMVAPSAEFAGVSADNIMVGMSYQSATVSQINTSDIMRRSDLPLVSVKLVRHERFISKRQTGSAILTEQYAFVGQIDASVMTANMNTSTLQTVLLPTISLSATDTSGNPVNTTLRSDMSSYVTGALSEAATNTTATTTEAVVTSVPPFNIPSSTIFIVPGTAIILFPIGGIITGIWTVLFIATVGYGTIGRIGFREQYRRNSARATKGTAPRI